MRTMIKTAALSLALPGLLAGAFPASAATAVGNHAAVIPAWNDHHGWRGGDDDDDDGYRRGNYGRRSYYEGRSSWRGEDGRYYCRRSDGTVGLLVGGVAGGLLGREVAGRRGDRTAGFLLGAVGGALIGRAIDRGGSSCR
jgi:Glycine zipper 2TM domain